MPQVLTDIEKTRRAELTADTRSALAMGLSLDEFLPLRDANVANWCQWLHAEMDKMNASEPFEILPQICARLEQRCAAAAHKSAKAAAQEMVRTMFAKASR